MFNVNEVKKLTKEWNYGFFHMPVFRKPTELVLIGESEDVSSVDYGFQDSLIQMLRPQVILCQLEDMLSSSNKFKQERADYLKWKFNVEVKSCDMLKEKKDECDNFIYNLFKRQNILSSIEMESHVDYNLIQETYMGAEIRDEIGFRRNQSFKYTQAMEREKSSYVNIDRPIVAIVNARHIWPGSGLINVLSQLTLPTNEREREISYVAINQDPAYLSMANVRARNFEYPF